MMRLKHSTKKGQVKTPFQHPITFWKGAAHMTLSRQFVGFLLQDKIAEELRAWSEDAPHPDEMVILTLQHNPQLGAPGAYAGKMDNSVY